MHIRCEVYIYEVTVQDAAGVEYLPDNVSPADRILMHYPIGDCTFPK